MPPNAPSIAAPPDAATPTPASARSRSEPEPREAAWPASRGTTRVVVVIPTIRSLAFLDDWEEEFGGCQIIVCEDHPERQIELPTGWSIEHYSWAEIDRELGPRAWVIPRQNAAIRNFGYWKAWQSGADVIVTIDDDCYPGSRPFLATHLANLERRVTLGWQPVCGFYTRGFPYGIRDAHPVVVSHGLWEGIPDLDAPTQLLHGDLRLERPETSQVVPRGSYFPMSGMNLAFRAEFAPAMWFPLMGRGWPFDRFDDIWAGVLAKRVADHLGLAMVSGLPTVDHRRASNVFANLKKEAAGIEANETFWRAVDSVRLDATTVGGAYRELAERLPLEGPYFDRLRQGMLTWLELFS
jgi:reversibly glycosylated polypeptide/UDP-arabinopyranose mutase